MAKNRQTWVVPRENKTNGRQLYLYDKKISAIKFFSGAGLNPFQLTIVLISMFQLSTFFVQNVESMLTTCWVSAWGMMSS